MYRPEDRYPYSGGGNRYRPDDRYPDYGGGGGSGGGGNRYRPDDRYPDYNSMGGGRYRPDDRYGPPPMFPPTRRIPPRYPARFPPMIDNSIGGDGRYPENRYPDKQDMDGRYYPTTVTGTRYPTSDNRFPVGNDRNPIFILKYGNRYPSSGASGSVTN